MLDKNEVTDLLAMNFKESGVSKKPTKQDVEDFFKQIDEDGNHEIDFDEFKDFMLQNMAKKLITPLRAYLIAEGFHLEDLWKADQPVYQNA